MTNVYEIFNKAGEKKARQLKRKLVGICGNEATVSYDGIVQALQDTDIVNSQHQGRQAVMTLDQHWVPLGKGLMSCKKYLVFEKKDLSFYKVSVKDDFLYSGED